MEKVLLDSIDAGNTPAYLFFDLDENSILLKSAQDDGQKIKIDKKCLAVMASTFRELAKRFGGCAKLRESPDTP